MENQKAYLFTMNGAGIKMHDKLESAMAQARQWKASNPDKHITVEEHEYVRNCPSSWVRVQRGVIEIEIPSLVPELTKKHDFDYLPALAVLGVHQW